MSPPRTPNTKLRKIRDLLRSGKSQVEVARLCVVSPSVVIRQGKILEAFERLERNLPGKIASIGAKAGNFARMKSGDDFDDRALDLVDIFASPRSSRQLSRAMRGQ
jgi:hypothetical protein